VLYLDVANEKNIPYRLASSHVLAEKRGKTNVVFYPYSKVLRSLADWYAQLSTESVQKKGQGQNVIATCGPIGNHSILNGILEGRRDKIVLFLRVEAFDSKKDFTIPKGSGIGGELAALEGKKMGSIQNFSQLGTEISFTQNGVLNTTLSIPQVNTLNLFKLMYTLEVSTAIEGKLRGLEFQDTQGQLRDLTYEQDGVEGYKRETRRLLVEKDKK
jgi:glucose-6-phosphate isomerase